MRTHKKAWLACLLTVAMLLSLVPMTAFATGDTVTDEDGLRAAIAEGGEITIGENFIIADTITINKDVVINLNGYSVSLPSGMGYSAEAAFVVSGADVVVNGDAWGSSLGYAGSGSLFKLVAVADATTSVTVNSGNCTTQDNYDPDAGENMYPVSLFAVSAPTGTVKPTIALYGGGFSSITLDPELGYGSTGPLISGDAADFKIYGGSFYIDPQEYLVDGAVSFEQTWGGEWQVLSEDAQMSDEFRSLLNEDGVCVVNRYEPKTEDDLWYLLDALMMYYWSQEEGPYPDFHISTYDADDKTVFVSLMDDYGYPTETHKVPLVFSYDSALKAEVDKLIAELPDKVETPEGFKLYYFAVNDLELINYWLTCSEEVDNINLLINYSGEFKKFIGHKNFRLDARMGDGDIFYTATAGIAEFGYNGTVYGAKEFGARAEHILYVADDATDVVIAAQDRVDAYLGEGKVVLENCGTVLDALEYMCYENDWEWHEQNPDGTFEDYKASGRCPQIDNVAEETDIEGLLATDICVKTEINGMTYYMIIKKDSDKLVTPTYQNVDVNTEIAVKSESTSIPLDTMLEVEQLTDGEEYDKIIAALDVEESVSFDIKLHSDSLDQYVTKLDNGQFEVKIPVPENLKGKALTVYYVDVQGKVTPHTVTPEGNYATFVTDHFSIYTLAAAADDSAHGHAYDSKWEYDKDNHWQECSCGFKAELAPHTFKDGKCSVCGVVADDAGESPLTGDAGIPVLVIVLILVGAAAIALTVKGKKKAEK